MCAQNYTPLNCLIIDDEPSAHQVLEYHIGKTPFLRLCGSFYDAINALAHLPFMDVDLIFLDVNMPELTGFQLLDIHASKKFKVILTTAHTQYAIDGYQYDITSFLLKPITFEKFLKAVSKVHMSFQTEVPKILPMASSTVEGVQEAILPSHSGDMATEDQYPCFSKDSMWIKVEKKTHRLRYEEILFVEAQKNYVKIHGKSQDLVTRASLNALERNLPPTRFLRTHRSYIVNRDAVKTVEGNTITMNNDYRVSISSSERLSVFRSLFL